MASFQHVLLYLLRDVVESDAASHPDGYATGAKSWSSLLLTDRCCERAYAPTFGTAKALERIRKKVLHHSRACDDHTEGMFPGEHITKTVDQCHVDEGAAVCLQRAWRKQSIYDVHSYMWIGIYSDVEVRAFA